MICSSLNLLRFKSGHFHVVRIPAAHGEEARGHVTETAEEASIFYEERCAFLDRMVAEPSIPLRDFAMKLVAATGCGADDGNVWISKLLAEACDIAGVPASRDLLEALA